MYIYQNGGSTQSTGLNIELFNHAPAGTGQGFVTNIQGCVTNIGMNTYAAGGANTQQNTAIGIRAAAAGNTYSTAANAAEFTASNAPSTIGVQASAVGNAGTTFSFGSNFSATGGQSNVAVRATANSSSNTLYNTAVEATANDNGYNAVQYGIYASIQGGYRNLSTPSMSSYAGYFYDRSYSISGPATGAAFFNGNVIASGSGIYTISDKMFKKDIEELNSGLDLILRLSPKTYSFVDKSKFPSFNFSEGKQYGFIAQELEEVIPEMVKEAVNPAQFDSEGNKIDDQVTFKSVNYNVLIPILTAGMQEQQKLIEAKDAKINELEGRIAKLEEMANSNNGTNVGNVEPKGILFQNNPNPFNGSTDIRYSIPQEYTRATVMIFDMNGRKIKAISLQGAEGLLTVTADEMAEGMYLYSLVVDGQAVATKRMVVNK